MPRLPAGTPIESWWQDGARGGQKNRITRRWAKRGSPPSPPHDQRTKSADIFGAVCPDRGVGAALALPRCNTAAMRRNRRPGRSVRPRRPHTSSTGRGRHITDKLTVPDTITIPPLPPRSPKLNPLKNIWQFPRDNRLSNRLFASYDQIVALCCHAWNNLIDQPCKIISIGRRQGAHEF